MGKTRTTLNSTVLVLKPVQARRRFPYLGSPRGIFYLLHLRQKNDTSTSFDADGKKWPELALLE